MEQINGQQNERIAKLEVEIIGMWTQLCIASAIKESLKHGLDVRVPKGYTIQHPNDNDSLLDAVKERVNKLCKYKTKEDDEFFYFKPKRK